MNELVRKHVVIVGGGAAGLELAARLSRLKQKNFKLTLIDNKLKHIWKPLLHEIAAGTLEQDAIDYIAYAHERGFDFHLGSILNIDRKQQTITLAPFSDDAQEVLLPERILHYDVLVLAIGSLTNDFNIPGVKEHCLMLDNLKQAERFNKALLKEIITYTEPEITPSIPAAFIPSLAAAGATEESMKPTKVKIAIVGAGATGVELAAEIQAMLAKVATFLNRQYENWIELNLIEAASRILNTLPEKISTAVEKSLIEKKIHVIKNCAIEEVLPGGVKAKNGLFIESTLTVWAAGVKGDVCLSGLDSLPVNGINQLKVNAYLQTTDANIFALGDCANCDWLDHPGKAVPPRAQAAHQQAALLVKSIPAYLANQPLKPFYYRDHGSLIALTHSNVIGTLMTRTAKSIYLEGLLARLSYWFLYKKHLYVLKGFRFVLWHTLSDWMLKRQKVRIKLH